MKNGSALDHCRFKEKGNTKSLVAAPSSFSSGACNATVVVDIKYSKPSHPCHDPVSDYYSIKNFTTLLWTLPEVVRLPHRSCLDPNSSTKPPSLFYHLPVRVTNVMSKVFSTLLSAFHISASMASQAGSPAGPFCQIETVYSGALTRPTTIYSPSINTIKTLHFPIPEQSLADKAPIDVLRYQCSLLRLQCHALR
jgi:hypothetical protein